MKISTQGDSLVAAFGVVLLCTSNAGSSGIHHSKTFCFPSLTHYYSNPKVSGAEKLDFTVKPNVTTSVEIQCSKTNAFFIQLDSIKLSVPPSDESFCPESKITNFTTCKSSSQCDCCKRPNEVYIVSMNNTQNYGKICDGFNHCTLTLTSQMIRDCSKFDECWSRWVDISYTCTNISALTPRDGTDDKTLVWTICIFSIFLAVICIGAVVIIIIIYKRRQNMQQAVNISDRGNEELLSTLQRLEEMMSNAKQQDQSPESLPLQDNNPERNNNIERQGMMDVV